MYKKLLPAICLAILLPVLQTEAQKNSLPRSLPETEGVSAAGIDSFLTAVAGSKNELHSFMLVRHGKVVAEGWWNPYGPNLKHTLYSLSKSFTSTAVGFAVTEKKLAVNDKVISFFHESLPDTVSPYLAQLTVKDLLTMSVGQDPDPTSVIPFTSYDWVKSFLATPIKNKPGTKFLYNTMATFMLSAIVQKVTGQKVIDYLRPRLFAPLGIQGNDWEMSSNGINTGGWGHRVKTEDIAKFAQLYLQKGEWNGKQILPREWVEEATSFKIDQAPDAPQSKKDSSDWMQGYCYQFWRCRNGGYRGDGAFGQYAIVLPGQDAVVAITCETPDMQNEINLVWQYLLPSLHAGKLPANKTADGALKQHLAHLSLPPVQSSSSLAQTAEGKTFVLQSNALHLNSLAFSHTGSVYNVTFTSDSGTYKIGFGNGAWQLGETAMPGPGLLSAAHENVAFLKPYKIAGSCGWLDEKTVLLKLRYIESPHSYTITCHFNGDAMTAKVENSFDYGKKSLELQGQAGK